MRSWWPAMATCGTCRASPGIWRPTSRCANLDGTSLLSIYIHAWNRFIFNRSQSLPCFGTRVKAKTRWNEQQRGQKLVVRRDILWSWACASRAASDCLWYSSTCLKSNHGLGVGWRELKCHRFEVLISPMSPSAWSHNKCVRYLRYMVCVSSRQAEHITLHARLHARTDISTDVTSVHFCILLYM